MGNYTLLRLQKDLRHIFLPDQEHRQMLCWNIVNHHKVLGCALLWSLLLDNNLNLWSGKDSLFESKILNHNDRFEFTFSDFKSGIYPYYCIMHPWMKGLVSIAEQLNFMVSSKSHGFR